MQIQRLMMKVAHNIVYGITVLLTLALSACKAEHNAVYDLLAFRAEIEVNHSEWTQAEWEDAISRYNGICKQLDEMPLTKEERMEIEKIKGKIAGYASSIFISETADKVQDIIDKAVSFSDGFLETFQPVLNSVR